MADNISDKLSGGLRVALLILLLTLLYLTAVTFLPMTPAGAEHSKTIVGFFLGSVFGTLVNYYWGSSSKGTQQQPPVEEKKDGTGA